MAHDQRGRPPLGRSPSTDPWAWTAATGAASRPLDVQAMRYAVWPLDDGRLVLATRYDDGRPFRAMPSRIGAAERDILASISALPRIHADEINVLEGGRGDAVLQALLADWRVEDARHRTVAREADVPAGPGWTADAAGNQRFRLLPDDRASEAAFVVDAGGPWLMRGATLARIDAAVDRATAMRLHLSGALPPERSAAVAGRLPEDAAPTAIAVVEEDAAPTTALSMERDGGVPVARIGASYAGVRVDPSDASPTARSYDPATATLRVVRRDRAAEAAILSDPALLGLEPTADPAVFRYSADGSDADAAVFADRAAAGLAADGWDVSEGRGWNIRPTRISRLALEVALGRGERGGPTEPGMILDVVGDGRTIDFIEPLAAIARTIPLDAERDEAEAILAAHVRGPDAVLTDGMGRVWLVPADEFVQLAFALRRILAAPRPEFQPVRVDAYCVADLAELSADVGLTAPDSLARLLNAMRAGEAEPIAWPTGFAGERDDRQLAAASWMRALLDAGYGGVLADDVGFGKTAEIALHVLATREAGRLGNGALIAAPKDALEGWIAKLALFAPDLTVVLWRGRGQALPAADAVVVASHEAIKGLDAPLAERSWTLAFLDEAQDAKKPTSILAVAFSSLDAEQKVPTTATPIENSLDDLWSMVNMANPGLLGDLESFRRTLAHPIRDRADVVAANRLNAMVAPFVLQRIDATRPMPTVEDVEVRLTGDQRDAYDLIVASVRAGFAARRARVEETGVGAERLGASVMLALTRLRQLCCSPMLLDDGIAGPTTPYLASPKTRAMTDLALRYRDDGGRVIVFSSWVGHLDLVERAMESMGLRCVRMDGGMSVGARKRSCDLFRAHAADVILMTTRTGGRAIDLEQADAVFMADPWWNPKVERQAIGRATRRGRTTSVNVHRFLAAAPVERAIMEIARRKDHLSALIAPGRAVESCSGLTLADVDHLLDTFARVAEDMGMAA